MQMVPGLEWQKAEERAAGLSLAAEYRLEDRWAFRSGWARGDAAPRLGFGFRDVTPDLTLSVDLGWLRNGDNGHVFRFSFGLGF